MPAKPQPITMTSALSKGSSTLAVWPSFTGSASPRATARALATASLMASEVMVAPEMLSTSVELASLMAAGIFSMAGSEMPAVSAWPVTSTAVMAFSSTVTSTVSLPPMPFSEIPT